MSFVKGQKWFSESEAEIGAGEITLIKGKIIEIFFSLIGETRSYSKENSSLKRVVFKKDDKVTLKNGEVISINEVSFEFDLYSYLSLENNSWIIESELGSEIPAPGIIDRLMCGDLSTIEEYLLRAKALELLNEIEHDPNRGLIGNRIELISHQLFIARKITENHNIRVLLADEVGLGKTIEACLVLNRAKSLGLINRVLIAVPQPLVFQWFVELYRKFNLSFSTIDNEKAKSIKEDGETNIFDQNNQYIISQDLLLSDDIVKQIKYAEFEMLIIDEAHHLNLQGNSTLENLIKEIKHIILITATPTEFGEKEHFNRLKLLDNDRFHDFNSYMKEKDSYSLIGNTIKNIFNAPSISEKDKGIIKNFLGESNKELFAKEFDLNQVLRQIMDFCGTSRVFFRNSRKNIKGFPKRVLKQYRLKNCLAEILSLSSNFTIKINWFALLLEQLKDEKVLVITSSIIEAKQIAKSLREEKGILAALFHEELTLLERDRNAAWFSEEDGVQIIICSEIGSEGRNFQFSHNLVFWDIPESLGLIEQRIGRIDRIGQKKEVVIHLPLMKESKEAFFSRWLHEGVNIFEENFSGLDQIETKFLKNTLSIIEKNDLKKLDQIIEETKEFKTKLKETLEEGKDFLLEKNSFNYEKGAEIISEISSAFSKPLLEDFMLGYWELSGVNIEKTDKHSYILNTQIADSDALPSDILSIFEVTFSYQQAINREEIIFLSYDHPLVLFALDYLLSSEKGRLSLAFTSEAGMDKFYLEVVYRLDCSETYYKSLGALVMGNTLRVLLNPELIDKSSEYTQSLLTKKTQIVPEKFHKSIIQAFKKILLLLMKESDKKSDFLVARKKNEALLTLETEKKYEILRIENLYKNDKDTYFKALEKVELDFNRMKKAVNDSAIHLESIRFIVKNG